MKTRKLTLCRMILSILLACVVVWSISVGNSILVVVAIIAGLAVTILLRRKDERIHVDERIQLINEKSATATVKIYVLGSTLVGGVLLALDNSGYAYLYQSGFTLMYSACALMILNLIFGSYYRRKYGG
jgi:uncharacterized membrane protein